MPFDQRSLKPAAQAAGADPDKAPPIGKIYRFTKMDVTFEPLVGFWCPSGFKNFLIPMTYSILYFKDVSLTVLVWRSRKAVGGKD